MDLPDIPVAASSKENGSDNGDRASICWEEGGLYIRQYRSEDDLDLVMALIDNELSEPYSIFTYRYFIYNWPNLCYLAFDSATGKAFGTVVCKLDSHRGTVRGYLAMLTVEKEYRGKMIGTRLVRLGIQEMIACGAEEVVLEAEVNNHGALRLYTNLGFIRDKRLHRYYLNGGDAFRLKLLVPSAEVARQGERRGEELTELILEPTVQKLTI
mmetsp:Transcript_12367/g.34730  ORF Transcript_12367/g.34730 Transcript_12367/m.34730 type:complete len:212 (-) Transcript_12367:311-946(-)|eukprot:CAMPEP_0117667722 /NCGR_PEP_ID=MMETSP0804-20121206/11135_1 /TAXON_ID=1074897 /ORGANISM="Tetraselmis astigmatica, Strain CCMP880" /LENGTH=211 /DNA_ID=CAMNT_0005475501 /DNA_START=211 /DNA_END=846 /DNA_ORIENTATION=-